MLADFCWLPFLLKILTFSSTYLSLNGCLLQPPRTLFRNEVFYGGQRVLPWLLRNRLQVHSLHSCTALLRLAPCQDSSSFFLALQVCSFVGGLPSDSTYSSSLVMRAGDIGHALISTMKLAQSTCNMWSASSVHEFPQSCKLGSREIIMLL